MIIPAILSLIFSLGLLLLAVFLFNHSIQSNYGAVQPESENQPERAKLGAVAASRWLNVLRFGFLLLCVIALGFHAYWAFFVAGPLHKQDEYVSLKNSRDQRNRRIEEAGL